MSRWEKQAERDIWTLYDDDGVPQHEVFRLLTLGSAEHHYEVDQGPRASFSTLEEAMAFAEALPDEGE